MATSVPMPQLGESVVEGTILTWLKHEGDAVAEDDAIVEISTEKVDTEIPAPVSGTLSKILVQEGETVEVGTALCEIDEGGAGAAKPGEQPKAEQPDEQPKAEEPAEQPK